MRLWSIRTRIAFLAIAGLVLFVGYQAPALLLQRMHEVSKPDGRLVVADRRPVSSTRASTDDDRASHRLRPETAAQEIGAAGFDGPCWLMVLPSQVKKPQYR